MFKIARFRFTLAARAPQVRRSRRQTGASLVEYAFVVIVFLSLIFGVSGFGHALFAYHYLNEVAKEATRYATVRGLNCTKDQNGGSCQASNSASATAGPTSQSDVQAYVVSITPQSIDSSKVIATATWPGPSSPPLCFHDVTLPNGTVVPKVPDNSPGCTVAVTVAYPYNLNFPLLPVSTATTAPCTSSGFCLNSTSEMVIAH
jgi:Flp pilus assembly protein TadG